MLCIVVCGNTFLSFSMRAMQPMQGLVGDGLTASYRQFLGKPQGAFHPLYTPPSPHALSDPLAVLVDDALVASWVRQGLPSDPTSVQNGAIVSHSQRWPLLMDPQLQGIVWVKEKEAKNNLQVRAWAPQGGVQGA